MRRRKSAVVSSALLIALVLVAAQSTALAQNNYAKVKEFRIEPSIPPEAVACIECHKQTNPDLFGDWANSRHANANITCLDCHLAQPGDQDVAQDHEKYYGRSDLPYGDQKYKVPSPRFSPPRTVPAATRTRPFSTAKDCCRCIRGFGSIPVHRE